MTWRTLRGDGALPADSPEASVLALQIYLLGVSIPLLLLGALVDDLRRAERTMRRLAASILRVQDDERRRIARDLHDSTGQNLIAATLLTGQIQKMLPPTAEPAVRKLDELLQASIREIRTVSYVLHPPLLDEAGLGLALREYVDGFGERSGIKSIFRSRATSIGCQMMSNWSCSAWCRRRWPMSRGIPRARWQRSS